MRIQKWRGRVWNKDALLRPDGSRVKTSAEWTEKVRPAVLRFFDVVIVRDWLMWNETENTPELYA